MSKLFKAECSQCGRVFRQKSVTDMLAAIRAHIWKEHKVWMVGKIKSGLRRARGNNPSIQDLVSAIKTGSVRASTSVSHLMTEKRYQQAKLVLDVLESEMPNKMKLAWNAAEAVHDILKRK